MSTTTSTQIRLRERPVGEPTADTFETTTVDLPEPADGEVLLQIDHLSLDPYMRGRLSEAESYAEPLAVGDVVMGGTVGTVLASRHPDLAEGDQVLSYSGWQTHAVEPGRAVRKLDTGANPASTALGVLGMPGFTAYAGLLQIGRPQPGETVVVAAAMGPVGSAVGQIAKLKGARAVGIAGGPDKARALTEEMGFDVGLDHRADDFREQLASAVPDGIDVYFENVAGPVLDAVRRHLNLYARVPVCGLVANYNATAAPEGPDTLPGFLGQILTKSLTVRGFIQTEFVKDHYADFLAEMGQWVAQGKVRYREDVVEGLENAPEAFAGMLRGANTGKLLVKVS
ncbi:NADP-dependent oxidoreductase [Marmoricola endophyticus]|uniref:NADP-dependent oxidoreductase n=1 Tax=Marmoricola endophyticus TaxID=2040280 RepID=A0A917BCN4_9ACTN|nr:NADP-dependent oxidoreductase [Marmoricola endophyticus]GGF36835.1 NADP-dependent oxidoreductase [Marmoricola endophyticus]